MTLSEPGQGLNQDVARGESRSASGPQPYPKSGWLKRWREAWRCGEVLYYSYLLVMLGTPVLGWLLGGPNWGRGLAVVCGTIWFFFGYDNGVGFYALIVYQLVLLGLMLQLIYYNQLAK